MPQEREYTGTSLNRVESLNKNLFADHQRHTRNKQIIDNYIFEDPSRITDSNFIAKSEAVNVQDAANIEKAKDFVEKHYHELVDIAMNDAARAGKAIIDARDFYDPEPVQQGSESQRFNVLRVPKYNEIVDAREKVILAYCAEKGIQKKDITVQQLQEIRARPEWINPIVDDEN